MQIKWKNSDEFTWISEEDLISCQDVIARFMNKHQPLVLVKDLQKELGLPELIQQPNEMYRKRQLHVFNMGIFNCTRNQMTCCVWDEYIGFKTADDIISVLWKYLEGKHDPTKHLIMWSDNCVAQNTRYLICSIII